VLKYYCLYMNPKPKFKSYHIYDSKFQIEIALTQISKDRKHASKNQIT
jgi:hypothetical protein